MQLMIVVGRVLQATESISRRHPVLGRFVALMEDEIGWGGEWLQICTVTAGSTVAAITVNTLYSVFAAW